MFTFGQKERQAKVDWLMLGALGGLMILGVLFIYSATMANESASAMPWYRQNWCMQIAWCGIGITAAAAVCLVDYHLLARWSLVAYWATILLLVAVLIPGIGTTHG